MESLAEMISQSTTSTDMKISAFTLLNKYYSGYPTNVESRQDTSEKFENFISIYIKQLCTFMKFCLQGKECLQIGFDYFELIPSSLELVGSMLCKEFDVEMIREEMDLFVTVVNMIISLNITSGIAQFIDIHV